MPKFGMRYPLPECFGHANAEKLSYIKFLFCSLYPSINDLGGKCKCQPMTNALLARRVYKIYIRKIFCNRSLPGSIERMKL